MAIADVRHEVVLALAHIHEAQREARSLVDHGADDERVFAAGELDFLDRQEGMLRDRLGEIDGLSAEPHTMVSWVRQEWFNLMFQLDNWIAHG
jgi:hypothetical protein